MEYGWLGPLPGVVADDGIWKQGLSGKEDKCHLTAAVSLQDPVVIYCLGFSQF